MKVCRTCGIEKDLTEFYTHSEMADGHLNKCKTCVKTRVHKYRKENIDTVRLHDRIRPRDKEKTRAYNKKWRNENPEKYKAETALNNAIRDGRVIRGTHCEIKGCERIKLHAHHDDYSKPFDVRWLCVVHHMVETRKVNAF